MSNEKLNSVEWYAKKDTEATIQFLEGKMNQLQFAMKKATNLAVANEMHKKEMIESYNEGWSHAEDQD